MPVVPVDALELQMGDQWKLRHLRCGHLRRLIRLSIDIPQHRVICTNAILLDVVECFNVP